MTRGRLTWMAALSIVGALGLRLVAQATPVERAWQRPTGFPPPRMPADHPVSGARVDLGRYLFTTSECPQTGRSRAPAVTNSADLVAFLQALTDDALLHDPRFADAWTPGPAIPRHPSR